VTVPDHSVALRRLLDAWAHADAAALADLVTDEVSGWSPNGLVRSRAELIEVIGDADDALSDVQSVVDAVDAVGVKAFAEWHLSALHTGPLQLGDGLVVEPTGRLVHLAGSTVAEFDGDRICAFRHYFDDLALLEQTLTDA
jgi:hypothetical protein